jgi:uncharacterized protein GlcG (DUF336 family)
VKDLPLSLAVEAASAALADCSGKGHLVSVSAVDRAGQLRVLMRGDDAGPHTADTSRRKAFTALTTKNTSAKVGENIRNDPAAANLVFVTDFLALGGGVPIRVGNEVIGAIGVSGAPGGHLDEQCSEAGIARIRDRLG